MRSGDGEKTKHEEKKTKGHELRQEETEKEERSQV